MKAKPFFVLGSLAVLIQAVSGWWDVFSHRIEFVDEDPLLNPAHVLSLIPVRPSGLGLLRLFVIIQLMSGVANEIIHRIPHLEAVLDFYIHSLFTLGMLLASLLLFVGASLSYLVTGRVGRDLVMLWSISMSGAALWLISSGSILYLFHQNMTATALMLGLIASIILNTATAASMRVGVAALTSATYFTASYLVLVLYAGVEPYPPSGPSTVLLVESMVALIAVKAGRVKTSLLSGGALYGLLTEIIYYPMLGSPWAVMEPSMWGLIGGILGALPILLLGGHISQLYRSKIPVV